MRTPLKGLPLLRLFVRELRNQRKRMTLTVLALLWGTFSIILLLSFGDGLRLQMEKANAGLGKAIVMIFGGQTSKPYQGLGKGRQIFLVEEDVDLLRSRIPEIEYISPENERGGVTVTYGRNSFTRSVIGVYPAFSELRTYYPAAGSRFLNEIDLEKRRRVIFLGAKVKEKIFGPADALGKTLFINNIPFLVIGVMPKKLQSSMYNGPDDEKMAIPFSTYKAIFGEKHVERVIYKPRDIAAATTVKKELFRVLSLKYKFDPEDSQALRFWDTIEGEKIFNQVFLGFQIFMGIMGGLTLMVAGVGVANIMYVSAKRRTREIGIKMALGAKKRHVLFQFVSEALMIAFAGGVAGMALSLVVVHLLGFVKLQGGAIDLIGHPIVSSRTMIITAAILGLTGFLAGFFPARRAASLNPVEALRYE